MAKHVGKGLLFASLIGIAMLWGCGDENPAGGGGGGLPGTWGMTQFTMDIGGMQITLPASDTTMQHVLELKSDQTYSSTYSEYDDASGTLVSETETGTWSTSGSTFTTTPTGGTATSGTYTQSGDVLTLTTTEDDGMGGTMTVTATYKRR